jgi:hypothetical protein
LSTKQIILISLPIVGFSITILILLYRRRK